MSASHVRFPRVAVIPRNAAPMMSSMLTRRRSLRTGAVKQPRSSSRGVSSRVPLDASERIISTTPGIDVLPEVPLPLIQVMSRGVENFPAMMMEWSSKYGDIFTMQLRPGGPKTVIVADPDGWDKILRAEGDTPVTVGPALDYMKKYYQDRGEEGGGGNLALEEDDQWRRIRSALQDGMLRPSRAAGFTSSVVPVAQALSARLEVEPNPTPERLNDLLQRTTLTMIMAIMLGECDNGLVDGTASKEAEQYLDAARTIGELGSGFMNGPGLWRYVETPAWSQYVEAQSVAEAIQTNWVQQVMDELDSCEDEATVERLSQSYLARLLASRANNDDILSIKEVVSNVGGFVQGGVDTTSGLLSWLLVNLAMNPEAQDRLRAELVDKLGGADATKRAALGRSYNNMSSGGNDEEEDSSLALPYLEAVLRETYRLTTPVLGVPRRLPEDITINGIYVEKQTPLLLMTGKALKDDELFDDAKEFKPERWLGDASSKLCGKARKAISLAPFGRGKRMCIGSNIAQVEARVILVRLLQDYKIVTDATEPPSMRQRTVVVPHPMPALKFEKI